MKRLFLAVILVTAFTSPAFAAKSFTASVELPITTRIINLATMPVEDAMAFCERRAMTCPAIKVKYEQKYGTQEISDFDQVDTTRKIAMQDSAPIYE